MLLIRRRYGGNFRKCCWWSSPFFVRGYLGHIDTFPTNSDTMKLRAKLLGICLFCHVCQLRPMRVSLATYTKSSPSRYSSNPGRSSIIARMFGCRLGTLWPNSGHFSQILRTQLFLIIVTISSEWSSNETLLSCGYVCCLCCCQSMSKNTQSCFLR